MSSFLDGPAGGTSLQLRRAPIYLRVVIDQSGKIDALDQIDDEPKRGENIFVYKLQGKPIRYHLLCGGKNRNASGWYEDGNYALHNEQPDNATARNKHAWQSWTIQQQERNESPWQSKMPTSEKKGT